MGRDRIGPGNPNVAGNHDHHHRPIGFDHHHYGERGDVLYLNVCEPRPAARGLETPDGHAIHHDETGAVIGLTLLNVRHTLERDGRLTLTHPLERPRSRRTEANTRGCLTGEGLPTYNCGPTSTIASRELHARSTVLRAYPDGPGLPVRSRVGRPDGEELRDELTQVENLDAVADARPIVPHGREGVCPVAVVEAYPHL
jgi:uncharacterized protein YuzE